MAARRAFVCVGAAIAALTIVTAAGPAGAYVRTRTSTGAPLFWNHTIFGITAYLGDPPPELGELDLLAAAQAAAASWSRAAVRCTSVELRVSGNPAAEAPVRSDELSRITFRRTEWCRQPRDETEPCHDPTILALTTVFADKFTGEILDADVELNAVHFSWGDLLADPPPPGGVHDLQNALTHELGHFLGFDHSCTLDVPKPGLTDDLGHPVSRCADASEQAQRSVMFAAVVPSDTARRNLAPDDVRGLCAVYPAFAPVVESQGAAAGCQMSGGSLPAPASILWAVWPLAVIVVRARGRRPTTRSSTGPPPPPRACCRRRAC